MIKSYTVALFIISTLVSCGNGNNEDYMDKDLMKAAAESKSTSGTDTVVPAQQIINQPVTNTINTLTPVTPGTNAMPVSAPASPVTVNATQQTTAPGMNPPHGQPGHRCDIAVGAPLNSPPAQTSPPVSATINTQPNAQPTAPGMNPPHGQPGHRCDIAVGAPLNSQPAQTTSPVQSNNTPVTLTPAKPDSSQNE